MTDHELSTRDLAARSDSDQADPSPEATDSSTGVTGDHEQDSRFDSVGTDGPLTRDPATDSPSGTRAADTGTDSAVGDGGEQLDSDSGDTRTQNAPGPSTDQEPLFPSDQSERFTNRWQEIQTSFVDQPRDAVAQADALVADLMRRLAGSFSQERERLEAQWDSGGDVSTEDLRVALTRYRSFFDRLLSA